MPAPARIDAAGGRTSASPGRAPAAPGGPAGAQEQEAAPTAGSRSRAFGRPAVLLRLWQAVAVLLVIGLWDVVHRLGFLSEALIPSVGSVLQEVVSLPGSSAFWTDLGMTVSGALQGLGLAVLVGLPLGLAIGMLPALDRSTRLLVDLGRSFPVIALLPVMILIFGATNQMKVVVVFLGSLFPILIQTVYGARRIEPVIVDTVASFRIPGRLRFLKVALPSAGPYAATGIRVAASTAILIAVGVEVISQTPGLGRELVQAQTDGAPALALGYLFYAGVLGVVLNALLAAAEGRLLRWHRRGEEG
jgi:ABC-type nitrate/sulfonate/bicarbonate transport system permease component